MSAAWIAGSTSVLVAVLAALFTYWNNRRLGQRQDHLKRVNAQLEELYGPLLAIAETSTAAWDSLRQRLRPEDGYVLYVSQFTEAERDLWMTWIRTVFMPSNRKAAELITTKAHLVIGDEMPDCFLRLCAHVAGYEVTLKRWDEGDYTDLLSIIDHPRRLLLDYMRSSFVDLKRQQQRLLSLTQGS